MTGKDVTQNLQDLIPKSLDDVIRANRDRCRLALATDEELHGMATSISGAHCHHVISHWQIVVFHLSDPDGTTIISPRLVGRVLETGQPWITSQVTGIDEEAGLVRTRNSIYRIHGPRVEESELDLLHICVSLNTWGVGKLFGIAPFFY